MLIDLHLHSAASDGTDPPGDVPGWAAAAGADVIALTDHDTVAGVAAAAEHLPASMTLLPGAELSCRYRGRGVHLLGYLFDPADVELSAELDRLRRARIDRARATVDRLVELGAPLDWEQVAAQAAGGVIGRPHLARAMVQAGVVRDLDEAFTAEWLAPGGRAHVARYALSPARAIALVRGAGGVPVLAHPRATGQGYTVSDEVIAELATAGLTGIEADHPEHRTREADHLRGLAADLDLIVTGASDDHGAATGHRIGARRTAIGQYERLVGAARGCVPVTGGDADGW